MEERTVHEVRLVRETYPGPGGKPMVRNTWLIGMTGLDGETSTHILPEVAFANYAAAYWDPDEELPTVEELLDLMLHVEHAPSAPVRVEETVLIATVDGVQEPEPAPAADAAEQMRRRAFAGVPGARAEARAALMARVAEGKKRVRVASPKAQRKAAGAAAAAAAADPLEVIRQRVSLDPDAIAAARVALQGWRNPHRPTPPPPDERPDQATRVATLAEKLLAPTLMKLTERLQPDDTRRAAFERAAAARALARAHRREGGKP